MHDEMTEEEILEEFSKFPNLDLSSKINARLRLWNLKLTKQKLRGLWTIIEHQNKRKSIKTIRL